MDLRHMRTFVTVAELGTVSAAAQQLHIAQPALSRQIGDFEQELGLKLFDRVGRRLMLTSDGEQLLTDCEGLLNYASAIGERARLLRQGDNGVLRVAAAAPNIEAIFPGFLLRYGKRYPNVQVRLIDALGARLLAMVARGDVHLAQTIEHSVQVDDRRFDSLPLHPIDLLAAYDRKTSLGKDGAIEITDLAPYPLLLQDAEFIIRKTFDAACRLAGLKPKIALESRAPHTLLAMAEAGHGIAIIASALRTHGAKLRISAVTYRGKPLRVPLIVLWDKRRPRTRYATAFCEMLAEYMREVSPITRPSEMPRTSNRSRAAGRKVQK